MSVVLDTTAQRSRARVVLLAAADLYRQKRGTLLQCVDLAATEMLDCEYVRRVLRGVLWEQNLPAWEAHPMRRRADVWRLLKIAIRWCSRRTGGWYVAGTTRPVRSSVPAGRQWLEWLPGSR